MADCRRPEVASEVISGQNVKWVKVDIVTMFGRPGLNSLQIIQTAQHFVTTTEYAVYPITPNNSLARA